jgi:hypothetical protein
MTGKRVLFDVRATQPSRAAKFRGGGEYAKIVLRRLLDLRRDETILGYYDPDIWLDPQIENLIRELKTFSVSSSGDLQALIDQDVCDKVYSALPRRYCCDVDFSSVEFVFTVHGLRPIEMPTDKYEVLYSQGVLDILKYVYKTLNKRGFIKDRKRELAKLLYKETRKKTIVVVSPHTKYALLSHFPDLRDETIQLLYSPQKRISIPNSDGENEATLEKFDVFPREYFLIIMGNRWLKNAFRAMKALDEVFCDYPEANKKCVVLGLDQPERFSRILQNEDRFNFFGYVDQDELEVLYKYAYLFIYPTLNEGFGYPPLECMKYGTPTICSAITSMTNLYRDSVLYFNPYSIDEIKNRILWMLFEEGEWEKYSRLGTERSQFIATQQDKMLDNLCRLILA